MRKQTGNPADVELSDADIIHECVMRRWPWKRASAALKAKGWDQIDRWTARDEVVRLREERDSAKLLHEYADHVHRAECEGRDVGPLPRFLPCAPLASVLPLRLPARRSRKAGV